jgi:hypothetical protein
MFAQKYIISIGLVACIAAAVVLYAKYKKSEEEE